MEMRTLILDMEARANAARVFISQICREAGVGRSTWYKWKENLAAPSVLVWMRVEKVMAQHEADAKQKAGRDTAQEAPDA